MIYDNLENYTNFEEMQNEPTPSQTTPTVMIGTTAQKVLQDHDDDGMATDGNTTSNLIRLMQTDGGHRR